MRPERAAKLANAVYWAVWRLLDDEPDVETVQAMLIATAAENEAESLLRNIRPDDDAAMRAIERSVSDE